MNHFAAHLHSQQLELWAKDNKDRLGSLKDDWREILRGVYTEHLEALREQCMKAEVRRRGKHPSAISRANR